MTRARETEYGKGDDDRTEDHTAYKEGYAALNWRDSPEGDKRQEERERKKRVRDANEKGWTGLFEVTQQHMDALMPNRDAFIKYAPKE